MSDRKYAIQLVENTNRYQGEQVTSPFTEPLTLQGIVERVHDGDFPMFCRQVDTGRYEGLPDDLAEAPYRWFTDVVDVRGLSQFEGAFGDKIVVGVTGFLISSYLYTCYRYRSRLGTLHLILSTLTGSVTLMNSSSFRLNSYRYKRSPLP